VALSPTTDHHAASAFPSLMQPAEPGAESGAKSGAHSGAESAAELVAVSVVIVNFNAGDVLADCLASVLSQARQVIVVDNASEPEGFEPVIRRFAGHPGLTVIRSPKNGGFSYGCNLGIRASTEPAVLLLNPDCVVAPESLAAMADVLHAEERVGMVGGFITCTDGSEQGGGRRAVPTPWRSFVRGFGLSRFARRFPQTARRFPRLFNDFYLHLQPKPTEPIPVEAISGACILMKQQAMDDVGLLDEGYFLHCEDLDICMRFRKRGWGIFFVPHAPVLHHKGACSKNRTLFVEWHKHKGMMRFYHKHFRHQYPSALMMIVAAGVWSRFGAIAARHMAGKIGRQVVALPAMLARGRLPDRASAHVSGAVVARRRRAIVATRPAAS
jgi:GT2 family glycosyltransferase